MAKFSSKFGYDPKDSKSPILEDAPRWLRTGYTNDILNKLTYIDRDSRYGNDDERPLGVKELVETFCRLSRKDLPDNAYDSWVCNVELADSLASCEWYYFYDFVEKVGKCLKDSELFQFDEKWLESYSSAKYIAKVNALFKEENIAWRLDPNSELIREIPNALQKTIDRVDSALVDKYEPARQHYRKAVRYIYSKPIDPENGIKEIVSAIESVGRILYPGSATLGDVVRALRKSSSIPQSLVSLIDKFYSFANSESAVRHGGVTVSSIQLQDSEFCLHVGIATIRYLLSRHDQQL